jgi:hypothetical protein
MSIGVALCLGGCGEKEDYPSRYEGEEPVSLPSGSTPEREYVAALERTCTEGGVALVTQIRASMRRELAAGATRAEALLKGLAEGMPEFQERLAAFQEELPPPPEGREDFEDYWATVNFMAKLLEDTLEANAEGDHAAVQRLNSQLSELAYEREEVEQRYGIRACASATPAQLRAVLP